MYSQCSIKLQKEWLLESNVIGQVDNRFILAAHSTPSDKWLVLFDQHAIHERILLEELIQKSSCQMKNDLWPCERLQKVIAVSMSRSSLPVHPDLSRNSNAVRLGFDLEWDDKSELLLVRGVPSLLIKNTGLLSATHRELQDILKCVLSSGPTSLSPGSCPGLMSILQSKACHSAIRFGDILTPGECETLLRSLAKCQLPFQCAHGRPAAFPMTRVPKDIQNKGSRLQFHKLIASKSNR